MTSYLYEGIGDAPIPPELTTGAVTAVELDPARARLTGLFAQVLNSELGAAWTQVTNALGAGHRLYGTSPVQDTLELAPTSQELQQVKTPLPLLSVYRTGDVTFEEHTIAQDKATQQWQVLWIVGQASTTERRRLGDFLVAGSRAIRLAVEKRGHPDYEGGALQFFTGVGGLGGVRVMRANYDPQRLNESGEADWLIMQLWLETVEYGRWDQGAFGSVQNASFDIGVGDSTGTVPSLILADSRYPE